MHPSVLSGQVVRLGNVFIQVAALIASAVSNCALPRLYWFLRSTEPGRLIRAAAQDRDAALMCGVNVDRMYLFAFCIGVGSLGLVGAADCAVQLCQSQRRLEFYPDRVHRGVLGSMGNFAGALIAGHHRLVEAVGGLMTWACSNEFIIHSDVNSVRASPRHQAADRSTMPMMNRDQGAGEIAHASEPPHDEPGQGKFEPTLGLT